MINANDQSKLDLKAVRKQLEGENGPRYWRSLEQIANTEAFREIAGREFGIGGPSAPEGVSRRDFLALMAASVALAGLTGCDQPREVIVPHVRRPEDILPGRPLYYATAYEMGGHATGLLAKSHMGRPINLEGNGEHPASLGAIDPFAQASILSLYDPDRSQVVQHFGQIATWDAFLTAMGTEIEALHLTSGKGLRILSEPVISPTLADQRRRLLEQFPEATWHQYTPVTRDNRRDGALMAFGRDVDARYDLDRAKIILSLDSDFLVRGAGHLRYARQFARGRRVTDNGTINRLYAAECTPTLTGAMADHRHALSPAQLKSFAATLARRLTGRGGAEATTVPAWMDALVADLKRHKGQAIVMVGDYQPPEVHALGHAINKALGAFGTIIEFTDPIEAEPENHANSLRDLVSAMKAGEVETLLILGGNPVYDAPSDLPFGVQLDNVPLRIHVGQYEDETARVSQWHVPQRHFLEAWSDTRAFDGTISVIQPLIAPLYSGKSFHEVLGVLLGEPGKSGETLVREAHKQRWASDEFEMHWNRSLHDGVMRETRLPARQVSLQAEIDTWLEEADVAGGETEGLHLLIRPDPTVWDGRFANNGWLQELPKPLTKLTWDNAALISPALAERRNLQNGDVAAFELAGRTLRGPVWILPGQPRDCVTMHLGHGRRRAGRVGTGIGFDVNPIRTSAKPWEAAGLVLRKTGERKELACTQDHNSMEGRHHVRDGTIQQFREDPHFIQEMGHEPDEALSLYPAYEQADNAWGMAINLNTCIGCNACVIACQAENNIPIVGADEVRNGREMHWIRVDRYYAGGLDAPDTRFQPVPCMHCEDAPCEVVCPVAATVHSHEGLNEMVYNRCVGTRYCSNNCPYKVRRFNFYQYADFETPSLKLLRNPDVTVRSRGVMEKCTYCVQRINLARIEAKKEDRPIGDGDIITACQAACPTQAIVFGDISDPNSRVSKLKRQPHHYALLGELNTRPRTTYLAKLTNPSEGAEEARRHE